MLLGAIIQARMSSRRLPDKVLAPLHGRPLLSYLIERLEHCERLDGLVVATSSHRSDDQLAEFCRQRRLRCYRGPLHLVAWRVAGALCRCGFDAFARVCADSPLIDRDLVDRAAAELDSGGHDIVTNVHPRTYPRGQSVEVVRARPFLAAVRRMTRPEDQEHVTGYFYRHERRYRIHNLQRPMVGNGPGLAVDTPEDLQRIAALLAAMTRPQWQYGLDDILALGDGVLSTSAARR